VVSSSFTMTKGAQTFSRLAQDRLDQVSRGGKKKKDKGGKRLPIFLNSRLDRDAPPTSRIDLTSGPLDRKKRKAKKGPRRSTRTTSGKETRIF